VAAEAEEKVAEAEAQVEEAKEQVAAAEEQVVEAVSEATEAKIEAATAEAVVAEVEHMEEIAHGHDEEIAHGHDVDTEDDDGESAYEFLDEQARKAEDENMDIKVQGIISVTPVPTYQLGQTSEGEVLAQQDSAPSFLS
jgi:predicted S18 family serine protease